MHLLPISQISPLVPLLGPHHVSSDYHGLQHNLSGGSFHPDSHSPQHSIIVINCRFGHDTTVFTNTFNKFELTSVRKAPTDQYCAQALDFTPLPVPRSSSTPISPHAMLHSPPDRVCSLLLPEISGPGFLPGQFHTLFKFKYLNLDLLLWLNYLCLH